MSILDNPKVKGVGYVAKAIEVLILDKDFAGAYDAVLESIRQFGVQEDIKAFAARLDQSSTAVNIAPKVSEPSPVSPQTDEAIQVRPKK